MDDSTQTHKSTQKLLQAQSNWGSARSVTSIKPLDPWPCFVTVPLSVRLPYAEFVKYSYQEVAVEVYWLVIFIHRGLLHLFRIQSTNYPIYRWWLQMALYFVCILKKYCKMSVRRKTVILVAVVEWLDGNCASSVTNSSVSGSPQKTNNGFVIKECAKSFSRWMNKCDWQ